MKYRSFRQQPQFYEGVLTAYCTECNLNCLFCFSQSHKGEGRDHTPEEVVKKFVKLSQKAPHYIKQCRISGGEVTLEKEHILEVIRLLMEETDLSFILETNGIKIGQDPDFVKELSKFKKYADEGRFKIRISFKHIYPETFHALTGAQPDWVNYPKIALENLIDAGLYVILAFMDDWYGQQEITSIIQYMISLGLMEYADQYETNPEMIFEEKHFDPEGFLKYKNVPYTKGEIERKVIESLP